MNLTGLHILLTYRCTFECDHCFVWSSPSARGTMTLTQLRDVLDQAVSLGSISQIYFEGGEPFLYYPILLEAAKYAHSLSLPFGIVTNAFFRTDAEDMRFWLKPFADLGMNSLFISDDVFHSGLPPDDDRTEQDEHKSDDNNAGFVQDVASELGIESYIINTECPKVVDTKSGDVLEGGSLRFSGRAADKLADARYPRTLWESFTRCPHEDFIEVGRLHLDPYGNLFSCQGIVVGNLFESGLKRVVEEYDPDNHPVIGPLIRGGPAELVRQYNLQLEGTFIDACQLCYAARMLLLDDFPDHLKPLQVYGVL